MFGFLKKCRKRGIVVNQAEPTLAGELETIKPDFGNQCCKFNEDIDCKFPEPLMHEIGIITFVDSNYGNCKVAGKLITSLMSLICITSANWFEKI